MIIDSCIGSILAPIDIKNSPESKLAKPMQQAIFSDSS